jgi:hypothetical protein
MSRCLGKGCRDKRIGCNTLVANQKKPRQSGFWYKASRYELRDDRIVPARDATFTKYDLLSRDDQIEDRRDRNASRIYARLIQAVTDKIDPEGLPDQDDDQETDQSDRWHPISSAARQRQEVITRILEFSAAFGLLGILHRKYLRIVGPVVLSPDGTPMRIYCQRGEHFDWDPPQSWGRGLLLDENVNRSSMWIGAAHGYRDTTFEEMNTRYFGGDLPALIPAPESEEFFKNYGEPLVNWINEAVALARAVHDEDGDALSHLLRPSWTQYTLGPSLATAKFCAGSLLEAAAFQFLEDYNAGFELRYCCNATCPRRLYYDNDPRSSFCSQRCASTQRQREHRQKEKLTRQRRRVPERKRRQK